MIDDGTVDDEPIDNESINEEDFQIQLTENDKRYVLVNTRIDYQHRSGKLNKMCLYDFVSILYKKKMNPSDLKHLFKTAVSMEEKANEKGRPPNERYSFRKQHPQATTYVMKKYSEYRVPMLYGPQILDEIVTTLESDTVELFSHFLCRGALYLIFVTSIRHGKKHLNLDILFPNIRGRL